MQKSKGKIIKKTKLAIYGLGLIGGSLGLALKGKGYYRIGIGRNIRKLAYALRRGAVDAITTDVTEGVEDADIVVLALPVELILPTLKKIKPWLKKSAVVTDVGSVKGCIMRGAKNILPARFVGSHPMAGSEKSGIRFARKNLFHQAGCVVVPGKSHSRVIQRIKNLWRKAGANIVVLDEHTHDYLVAICSHLPHIIAYAMMHYLMHISSKHTAIVHMLAGSFRDITRVAMSSPDLWSQITLSNRMQIRKTVKEFNFFLKKINSTLHKPPVSRILFEKAAVERRNSLLY